MTSRIHSTALIEAGAVLGENVEVGPYAVIEAGVVLGSGSRIGPHVHLSGQTVLGENNILHAGCAIGDGPQDLKYKGEPTRLRIGDGNVFREHVTIHRSNSLAEDTVIGSGNYFMANSHVGHNCQLGNHIILANGALLGGHVSVADRVFISGNCLAHQFVRIGRGALMQGGSAISKDLPPFTIARGDNRICGLNIIGLRRAGVSAAERLELKKTYHRVFRSGLNIRPAAAAAEKECRGPLSRELVEFVLSSKRGVCPDISFGSEESGSDL